MNILMDGPLDLLIAEDRVTIRGESGGEQISLTFRVDDFKRAYDQATEMMHAIRRQEAEKHMAGLPKTQRRKASSNVVSIKGGS